MVKKTYSKVLPLKDNEKVVTQVGWLPLSVIEPPRQTKKIWKKAYLNDGLDEQGILIKNNLFRFE